MILKYRMKGANHSQVNVDSSVTMEIADLATSSVLDIATSINLNFFVSPTPEEVGNIKNNRYISMHIVLHCQLSYILLIVL